VAGTALAGGFNGGGPTASVVSPASMSVNLSMTGLQPLTQFAIARDPVFQAVIRETLIVAQSQGFRR
jgi:hypothetical protein